VKPILDESTCSISFSGACEGGGVYPDPYVAKVGVYSEITEEYVEGGLAQFKKVT